MRSILFSSKKSYYFLTDPFQEFKKDGPGSCCFQISAPILKLTYMAWTILDCLFGLKAKFERVPKF